MRCGEGTPSIFLHISCVPAVLRESQGHASLLCDAWERMSPIQQAHTEGLPCRPPAVCYGHIRCGRHAQGVQGLKGMGTVGGTETGPITQQLVTEAWRWSRLCGPDLARASEGSLQEEGLSGGKSLFIWDVSA